MSLTLRATKGAPLSIAEMDANLTFLSLLGFRVFNGLLYGCQPNDPTFDNAASITATCAAAAAVSGYAYFPAGVYYLPSAPAGAANCQVRLPYVPFTDGNGNRVSSKTLTIAGEGMIPWLDTGLPEYPSAVPTCGTIFYSTAQGSGTFPTVFGALGQTTDYGQYTNLDVKFRNCTVRNKANNGSGGTGPTMCGLDLGWCASSSVEQVRADVDARGPDTVEPTREVFGIRLTRTNGQTNVRLTDTLAIGYKYGYVCGEHTKAFNAQAFCCTHGVTFTKMNHGASLHGFLAQWCRYDISAGMIDPGICTVEITSASFEYKSVGQWFDSVTSVYDPQNLIYGNLKFIVVASNFGKDNSKFTKVGGANFFCYPTGYDYASGIAGSGATGGGNGSYVQAPGSSEEDAQTRSYSGGGWTNETNPIYSPGTSDAKGKYSTAAGDYYSEKFVADIIEIQQPITSLCGPIDVYVDGIKIGSWVGYQNATANSAVVATFDLAALINGYDKAATHTLKVVNVTEGKAILSDKVNYKIKAAAATGKTYSDSAGRTYSGAWAGDTAAGVYSDGHSGKYSTGQGDYYTQSGYATSAINISLPVGQNLGAFRVYLNGIDKGSYTAKQDGATQASKRLVSLAVSAGNYDVKVLNTTGGNSDVLTSDLIEYV